MSLPVPLGVRFFNARTGLDRWMTKNVDDVSFRSVIPGGFASATITFRADPAEGPVSAPLVRDRLVQLYTRVQIVDLRSAEIVWEGRVDDDAQVVDDSGERWELGVLGSMVSATDYQRPSFYINSGPDNWVELDSGEPPYLGFDRPDNSDKLRTILKYAWVWNPGNGLAAWEWRFARAVGQPVGRVDVQFYSTATGGSPEAGFQQILQIGTQTNLHVVNINTTTTRASYMGDGSFTAANAQALNVLVHAKRDPVAAAFTTTGDKPSMAFRPIAVQALRRDRYGAFLTAGSDYTHGAYVTVPQVVEDVIGRYLVACHTELFTTPGVYYGSVNPDKVYIDTSSTTQIKDLIYTDGVTAADIFADLMEIQTGSYWAIWESGMRDSIGSDIATRGYRFEWTQWPQGWGYILSTKDGFDEQRTARDLYKGAFVKFQNTYYNGEPTLEPVENPADPADVALADFRRFATIERDTPGTAAGSETIGQAWLSQYEHTYSQNAGSVTVRRPVTLIDAGANGDRGAAQTVQPWEIKPGKLGRITEIIPRARMTDHFHGTTAPPPEHDWNVFRIVATEYSSSDNSCRLDLDQPSKWRLPGQVAKNVSGPVGKRVVRG